MHTYLQIIFREGPFYFQFRPLKWVGTVDGIHRTKQIENQMTKKMTKGPEIQKT